MAHEINKDRAVYARKPAWHGIGTVLQDVFTAEEALHVLNPDKERVQKWTAAVIAPDGTVHATEDYQGIVRQEGERVNIMAFMSPQYGVIQLEEKFAFMDEVVRSVDGAHYEAVAELRKGKQTIATIDLGEVRLDPDGRNDLQKKKLFGSNSYDGSWAFRVKIVNFRVECANMAAMALRGSSDRLQRGDWSTRHTDGIMNRVSAAQRTLGLVVEYNDLFYAKAEELIRREATDNAFQRALDQVFLVDDVTEEKDVDAQNQVRAIYELSPSQVNLYGTWWGVYNAMSEYADWRTTVRGSKSTNIMEGRFIRQLDDSKGIKQRAWDYVVETAGV